MSTTQEASSRYLHSSTIRHFIIKYLPIVLFLGMLLWLIRPVWSSFVPGDVSESSAQAASAAVEQMDIPYFGSSAVQYNHTSVFWFGKVSSSDSYVDVRMGFNHTELYVNLNIIDRYVWYDTHQSSPNLSIGDTSTVYLDTAPSGSSAPQTTSYKFLAQVNNGQPRTNYQRAYKGNGTGWAVSSKPFTTVSGWRGTHLNGGDDEGWSMTYHIPFSSLGKSGAPALGASWKLAVQIHNETGPTGSSVTFRWWPAVAKDMVPSGWGNLNFGLPTYPTPQTTNNTTYTIQNGLNNQNVTDAMVGGGLACLNLHPGTSRWTLFGSQIYPQATRGDVENEQDLSDFNCFSKFYITFPLSSLRAGETVVSARITLHERGNMGKGTTSCVQVGTVNQSWSSSTINWNNAPSEGEVISSTVVQIDNGAPLPGTSYNWDVSVAVANAYASGQPLRLVFYSNDINHHSGKYFTSSYEPTWDQVGRPLLQITLGHPRK